MPTTTYPNGTPLDASNLNPPKITLNPNLVYLNIPQPTQAITVCPNLIQHPIILAHHRTKPDHVIMGVDTIATRWKNKSCLLLKMGTSIIKGSRWNIVSPEGSGSDEEVIMNDLRST